MTTTQRVKIGIIGLNFGRWIIEDIVNGPAKDYLELAAVCDKDEEKAKSFGEKFGVKVYTDIKDLLADDEIPTVGLFTGPVNRSSLLRTIIHAGKDVMTTKPFELDPVAAREILEEADKLGRVIQLNSPSPVPRDHLLKIQEWWKEHDLGAPVSCYGEVLASYREKPDGTWYDNPELCPAAPIFRLGIYLINDLVHLFGGVSSVQVTTSRIFTERPTPDNAQLGLLFKNKAIGNIFATFCVDDGQCYANSLMLHFERGSIQYNIRPVSEVGKSNTTSRLTLVARKSPEVIHVEECEQPSIGHGYQWELFHAAVLRTKEIPTPIDDIVHGVEVVAALIRAQGSQATEGV